MYTPGEKPVSLSCSGSECLSHGTRESLTAQRFPVNHYVFVSLALAALLLSGTLRPSAPSPPYGSFAASHYSLLGSIHDSFSSSVHLNDRTLIAATDADSEGSMGEKKDDDEDKDQGNDDLKDLWDSVQSG